MKIITEEEYRARIDALPEPEQLIAIADYAHVLDDNERVIHWEDVEISTHTYPVDGWQITLNEWQGGGLETIRLETVHNERVIDCCKLAAIRYALYQAYPDELAEYIINGHQIPDCEH